MKASHNAKATVLLAPPGDKAPHIRRMFARIVPRYDLMNRLMTLGQDRRWREITAREVQPQGALVLDIATGTGDLAMSLWHAGARRVVGLDFCEEMLDAASHKLPADALTSLHLVQGDALHLPFAEATFDCVASAFLLRNVADLEGCLTEMARVLRPGGRLVSLELTHPPPGFLGAAASLYSRYLVPLLGWLVTGDGDAYRYLPSSLHGFPDADELSRLMARAGLQEITYRRLGQGSIAIHRAVKRTQFAAQN